jgi:DNA integrity scanning protein DisA with diadenylate cyclase activity
MTEKIHKMSELSELKAEINQNEKTINRWKGERLDRIINQTVKLPIAEANTFYKIIDQFTDGFGTAALREKIDAQMPNLWELFPPPKNETEWTEYFNDLLADCAAERCITVREVWQIIGYDAAEFEGMRGRGFSFVQAFTEMHLKETDAQMQERVKDLSVEQYKERIEHSVNQWREGQEMIARLRNDAFDKFGVNIPLEDK